MRGFQPYGQERARLDWIWIAPWQAHCQPWSTDRRGVVVGPALPNPPIWIRESHGHRAASLLGTKCPTSGPYLWKDRIHASTSAAVRLMRQGAPMFGPRTCEPASWDQSLHM